MLRHFRNRRFRRHGAVAVLCLAVLLPVWGVRAQSEHPIAVVGEIDGIIHPIAAEYLDDVLDEADALDAAVVIIRLETPGGLLDSTRDMVSRIIDSKAPVVVFVGPAGARAASAGFLITIAADVAVMAPGTHIGAAHPVAGGGQQLDETMANKAASDAAAYVRSLAKARGRNVELASEAVLESRAFTATEALEASPPLIDFLADDLDDVLRQLDGRTVTRFDGRTTTLETSGAEVRLVEMTRRQKFLGAIAHPQVAYLLLTLGMLGLTVELWNPGAIVPGVAGGLCLLLAFFALQIVPVDTTGLLLIIFGIALLVAELFVSSFGILGVGGAISLVVGSIMMTRTVPGVTVSLGVVVPVAIGLAAIMLFLGRLALRAQRRRPVTGVEAFVGRTARVRTAIAPNAAGQVDIHGEIWRAVSSVPVAAGETVRVKDVQGLTLIVEPVGPAGELTDSAGRP